MGKLNLTELKKAYNTLNVQFHCMSLFTVATRAQGQYEHVVLYLIRDNNQLSQKEGKWIFLVQLLI